VNVLVFGDSADRHTTEECAAYGGTAASLSGWGLHVFRYSAQWQAGTLCDTAALSIAQLQVFGSPASGPYYGGYNTSAADPYVDTPKRLRKGLEVYMEQLQRVPDVVMLQAGTWDGTQLWFTSPGAPLATAHAEGYIANMRAHLGALRAALPATTAIAVRTTPLLESNVRHMREYNQATRFLAATAEPPVLLLDWATEFSGVTTPHYLRDAIHPARDHAAAFGWRLIRAAQALVRATETWATATASGKAGFAAGSVGASAPRTAA
jgi:hypothetical protein